MNRILATITAALATAGAVQAQTLLEGIVTDSTSGEVLPFVNIAVSGTTVGTISDLNGEYRLSVPAEMAGKPVTFSSVGYSPVSITLSKGAEQRTNVTLAPIDYKIEEIVVTDKSQAGRRVLRDVVESASSNYVNRSFSYEGTYISTSSAGGARRKATYHVLGYDGDGYTRSDGNNAFAALNYRFAGVVRDFKVDDYESGVNHFDQVCGLDVVRYQFGVLNSYTIKDFDFTIKSETDAEYVIDFKCNSPRLANTGAWSPRGYHGTMTINKSDKAITAVKYTMELGSYSALAMSLVPSGGAGEAAVVSCDVKYAKYNGRYAVKSIEATTTAGGKEVFSDSFAVTSVNFKTPRKVEGKVFYAR